MICKIETPFQLELITPYLPTAALRYLRMGDRPRWVSDHNYGDEAASYPVRGLYNTDKSEGFEGEHFGREVDFLTFYEHLVKTYKPVAEYDLQD